MARKPGRPASDEIVSEAAKQATDASKIPVDAADSETDQLIREANAILSNTARTEILKTAALNAKKAHLEAKREFKEAQEEISEFEKPSSSLNGFKSIPSGITPEDIRTIAETLPEEQREGFIRQALGMPGGNPLISAFMQRTPTAQAAIQPNNSQPAQNMTFTDMMQGMLAMMSMSMQLEQKKSEEWRQQQAYLEEQHRRRVEELREARGEVPQERGPDPATEAYKLQIDLLREELKTNREMLKDAITKREGGDVSSSLQQQILDLTQKNLDIQNQAQEAKLRAMEAQLQQNSKFNMSINDIVKQAQDSGANLRMGDATDLQLANDHEYRMKQLELQQEREEKLTNAKIAEYQAKVTEAESHKDLIKTLAVAVGTQLFSKQQSIPSVEESSNSVKKLVGAVQ
jgi:hypothetical protein